MNTCGKCEYWENIKLQPTQGKCKYAPPAPFAFLVPGPVVPGPGGSAQMIVNTLFPVTDENEGACRNFEPRAPRYADPVSKSLFDMANG